MVGNVLMEFQGGGAVSENRYPQHEGGLSLLRAHTDQNAYRLLDE